MFTLATPITVYSDGSYCASRQRAGYGWVCANGPKAAARARVVTTDTRKGITTMSCLMESAAIVDAICEFAPFGRKIVVHADNQALMHLIDRYQAGLSDSTEMLTSPNVVSETDGRRLLEALAKVEVELKWVKGHRNNFLNLVVDQMIRNAALEGDSEAEGVRFAEEAMDTCRAMIRCNRRLPGSDDWVNMLVEKFWTEETA